MVRPFTPFRLLTSLLVLAPLPGLAANVQTDTILINPPVLDAPTSTLPIQAIPNFPAENEGDVGVPAETSDEMSLEAPGTEPASEIFYDLSKLPRPVARTHDQLRAAALSGDLNQLRLVLESNEVMPTLSLTETGDPIEIIKASSGDGEGLETLAILADILDAGFVHVDQGTPQEMYVWPYFARYRLETLTPQQRVELYRIVTAGEVTEMENYGLWLFYRVGIGPDGTLHYFVAGE